jgi:hypothetical protein
MTPADRWDQVQEVFLAVADLTPADRQMALEERCHGDPALRAEVESLLQADSTSETVLGGALRTAIQTEATALFCGSPIEGSRIGAYRLLREIGRGGMGSVYLAARADEQFESIVAIKLVRPGLDTDFVLRRFRRERQILARLHHPNIALLLDGGTTENKIPYLVMEYVQGSRITKYAAEFHLSLEDRIRLFLPVCSAVEYAHRAFIVHRDLKPSNILVDSTGTPKLLDFGISKLLHSEPRDPADTQDVAMATPDYASPEQISGNPVTASSDVYSLGAVLYELLTGLRPRRIEQATPVAIERAICLEPTVPPSEAVRNKPTLSRRLAGDLDTIILHAMQREPERRYHSAEQLAEDLRRYLDHRPVMARPDSPGYRATRFILRNRGPVALVGAAAATAIVVAGRATYEARASRQRSRQFAATERDLQRKLITAYRRLGDLQPNTQAAVEAYTAMIEVARRRWESDPSDARSVSDYGAALLGLSVVLPVKPLAEKRRALERACAWLQEAVRQNPANRHLHEQLEDASSALDALQQRKRVE